MVYGLLIVANVRYL